MYKRQLPALARVGRPLRLIYRAGDSFVPEVAIAERIAAQLARAGALPGDGGRYVASQGRELGRDGRIHVRVDADDEAWIGGQVQAVLRGSLAWTTP